MSTNPQAGRPSYLNCLQTHATEPDLILVIQGKRFPVKRGRLASSCHLFESLFSDLPGACTLPKDEGEGAVVVLAGEDAGGETALPQEVVEAFPLFLKHIHHRSCSAAMHPEEALKLLPAADFFGAEWMVASCGHCLASPVRLQSILRGSGGVGINRQQLLSELATASRYQLRALAAACLPHLMEHLVQHPSAAGLCFSGLDPALLAALWEGVLSSGRCMYRDRAGGGGEPAVPVGVSMRVGGSAPAVSRECYEAALGRRKWGR